jgi:hypothetical protein
MRTIEEKCPDAVTSGDRGGVLKAARQSSFASPRLQVSNTWHQAKRRGDAAERAIAEHFIGLGFAVCKTIGRADFDLSIVKRIEVKCDDAAVRTRKAAIEVSHNGKPSGIHRTSASLWAIIVGSEAFMLETSALRELVESGNYREAPAGDGKRATCVLVPIDTLRWLPGVVVLHLGEDDNESAPLSAVG